MPGSSHRNDGITLRSLPRWAIAIAAAGAILAIGHDANAQFGGPGGPPLGNALKLKSPVPNQVFQRDINGLADIPIVLEEPLKEGDTISARVIEGPQGKMIGADTPDEMSLVGSYSKGKLRGLPTGGPYTLQIWVSGTNGQTSTTISPIFVGDLWVLAGQSNMEGVGDLIDVTPPHPMVQCLGMDGKWVNAQEPLHWLVDSPDPVHSGNPDDRAKRSEEQHRNRTKGAGLGLPFAVAMYKQTQVPIGLVACAHGGTSMEQWNPAKRGEGGNSLYGSFLRQVELAGNKVKGVLWYQGESDAMGDAWKVYPQVFTDFIKTVRNDLHSPDLPFYFVQIGRFAYANDPKGWNAVQDAQRLLPDRVPGTAVVSVIDLELDDLIHVGTQGLKRAGRRLAQIAQRDLFGRIGATTPTLDTLSRGPGNTLVLKFKGVNLQDQSSVTGLKPDRHIAGFSIRKEDGTAVPIIYDAAVGRSHDTVVLKLVGDIPEKSALWYGHGLDPYCNLVDSADMAVPVFGPIPLDQSAEVKPVPVAAASAPKPTAEAPKPAEPAKRDGKSKVLIITGDEYHDWKATTPVLKEILASTGAIEVDVTATPAKDLNDENLAKYDVLFLNYKDTDKGGPETKWSDANKEAFLKAVREGKGLVVSHFASAAFTKPMWDEFTKAIAGGWRTQGFHGPKHVFSVKKTDAKHPISDGAPAEFVHAIDELYQNSVMVPGSVVLATAYSDPNKEKGTGKDEAVIWVNQYGKGRVYNNVLGHDVEAISDPNYQTWLRRGVLWAATGEVPSQANVAPKARRLYASTYLDKMKGGWIGQMAGVGFGAPTEFRHLEEIVPEDKLPTWTPQMVNQFDQDDLYVEMTFLQTLVEHGLDVSTRQAGIDFANSRYPLWHANAAGRNLLRSGVAPPDSGHPALNSHADDIDYQIEADFSGLIAPGLPNTVIQLGETFGRIMNAGDGLYGGQFVGAMYAEAFFENDMTKIIQAGLAAIPKESQYHECISDVLAWHKENPNDWESTWHKIEEKYQKNRDYRRFSCSKDEKEPYKFNIDAKLNGAYIVMGLLYGNGDPDRTIYVSTRCGQDSDCNPSNAAGILFTTIGFSKLPEKYVSGLDVNTKFNSTPYNFTSLIEVCHMLADQAVQKAGGQIEKSADGSATYVLPVESARPSALETCWTPGPKAESRFTPDEVKQIVATNKE